MKRVGLFIMGVALCSPALASLVTRSVFYQTYWEWARVPPLLPGWRRVCDLHGHVWLEEARRAHGISQDTKSL